MLRLIVLKTEIRTKIQWKIYLFSDVLQLRVLFSKAFGLCRPRLASLLRLLFPIFVKSLHDFSICSFVIFRPVVYNDNIVTSHRKFGSILQIGFYATEVPFDAFIPVMAMLGLVLQGTCLCEQLVHSASQLLPFLRISHLLHLPLQFLCSLSYIAGLLSKLLYS